MSLNFVKPKKTTSLIILISFIFTTTTTYAAPSSRSLFKNKKVDYQKLSTQSEKRLQEKKDVLQGGGKGAAKQRKAAKRVLSSHLEDISQINIPQELGRVIDVHDASKGRSLDKLGAGERRLLVLIQDLHTNPEGQLNLAGILELLIKDYKLNLICSEGADGEVDTSSVSSFPDAEIREKTARLFIDSGELTGEEYLSIAKYPDLPIWGIEDREIYFENIVQFNKVMKFSPDSQVFISQTKKALEQLKPKIYSKELLSIDQKELDYEEERIETDEYLKHLSSYIQKFNIPTDKYKNITLLTEAAEQEKHINQEKIMKESQSLLLNLQTALSAKKARKDTGSLMAMARLFKDQKISPFSFYSYLKDLALKHLKDKMAKYPNLDDFIDYLTKVNSLDTTKLFTEMEDLSYEVKQHLCKTTKQKDLIKALRNIKFLQGLFNLKVSNEELDYYLANKDSHKVDWFKSTLTGLTGQQVNRQTGYIDFNPALIDGHLQELEDFYKTVKARDIAMFNNTISEVNKRNAKIAALVHGGFHTKGITRLLRDKAYSYIVVSPYSSTEIDEENYHFLLSGQRKPITELIEGLDNSLREALAFSSSEFRDFLLESLERHREEFERLEIDIDVANTRERLQRTMIAVAIREWRGQGRNNAFIGKQLALAFPGFDLQDIVHTDGTNSFHVNLGQNEYVQITTRRGIIRSDETGFSRGKGSPFDLWKALAEKGYKAGDPITYAEIKALRDEFGETAIRHEINNLLVDSGIGVLRRVKKDQYKVVRTANVAQVRTINKAARKVVSRVGIVDSKRGQASLGIDRYRLDDLPLKTLRDLVELVDNELTKPAYLAQEPYSDITGEEKVVAINGINDKAVDFFATAIEDRNIRISAMRGFPSFRRSGLAGITSFINELRRTHRSAVEGYKFYTVVDGKEEGVFSYWIVVETPEGKYQWIRAYDDIEMVNASLWTGRTVRAYDEIEMVNASLLTGRTSDSFRGSSVFIGIPDRSPSLMSPEELHKASGSPDVRFYSYPPDGVDSVVDFTPGETADMTVYRHRHTNSIGDTKVGEVVIPQYSESLTATDGLSVPVPYQGVVEQTLRGILQTAGAGITDSYMVSIVNEDRALPEGAEYSTDETRARGLGLVMVESPVVGSEYVVGGKGGTTFQATFFMNGPVSEEEVVKALEAAAGKGDIQLQEIYASLEAQRWPGEIVVSRSQIGIVNDAEKGIYMVVLNVFLDDASYQAQQIAGLVKGEAVDTMALPKKTTTISAREERLVHLAETSASEVVDMHEFKEAFVDFEGTRLVAIDGMLGRIGKPTIQRTFKLGWREDGTERVRVVSANGIAYLDETKTDKETVAANLERLDGAIRMLATDTAYGVWEGVIFDRGRDESGYYITITDETNPGHSWKIYVHNERSGVKNIPWYGYNADGTKKARTQVVEKEHIDMIVEGTGVHRDPVDAFDYREDANMVMITAPLKVKEQAKLAELQAQGLIVVTRIPGINDDVLFEEIARLAGYIKAIQPAKFKEIVFRLAREGDAAREEIRGELLRLIDDENLEQGVTREEYADALIEVSFIIVSNASCTTNCAAPIVSAIHKGISPVVAISLSTIHRPTKTQPMIDKLIKSLSRIFGAQITTNLTGTGASKALPAVIDGLDAETIKAWSQRVPGATASIVDMVIAVENDMSEEEFLDRLSRTIRDGRLKGRVAIAPPTWQGNIDDFIGHPAGSVLVDVKKIGKGKFAVRTLYDNEEGFTAALTRHAFQIFAEQDAYQGQAQVSPVRIDAPRRGSGTLGEGLLAFLKVVQEAGNLEQEFTARQFMALRGGLKQTTVRNELRYLYELGFFVRREEPGIGAIVTHYYQLAPWVQQILENDSTFIKYVDRLVKREQWLNIPQLGDRRSERRQQAASAMVEMLKDFIQETSDSEAQRIAQENLPLAQARHAIESNNDRLAITLLQQVISGEPTTAQVAQVEKVMERLAVDVGLEESYQLLRQRLAAVKENEPWEVGLREGPNFGRQLVELLMKTRLKSTQYELGIDLRRHEVAFAQSAAFDRRKRLHYGDLQLLKELFEGDIASLRGVSSIEELHLHAILKQKELLEDIFQKLDFRARHLDSQTQHEDFAAMVDYIYEGSSQVEVLIKRAEELVEELNSNRKTRLSKGLRPKKKSQRGDGTLGQGLLAFLRAAQEAENLELEFTIAQFIELRFPGLTTGEQARDYTMLRRELKYLEELGLLQRKKKRGKGSTYYYALAGWIQEILGNDLETFIQHINGLVTEEQWLDIPRLSDPRFPERRQEANLAVIEMLYGFIQQTGNHEARRIAQKTLAGVRQGLINSRLVEVLKRVRTLADNKEDSPSEIGFQAYQLMDEVDSALFGVIFGADDPAHPQSSIPTTRVPTIARFNATTEQLQLAIEITVLMSQMFQYLEVTDSDRIDVYATLGTLNKNREAALERCLGATEHFLELIPLLPSQFLIVLGQPDEWEVYARDTSDKLRWLSEDEVNFLLREALYIMKWIRIHRAAGRSPQGIRTVIMRALSGLSGDQLLLEWLGEGDDLTFQLGGLVVFTLSIDGHNLVEIQGLERWPSADWIADQGWKTWGDAAKADQYAVEYYQTIYMWTRRLQFQRGEALDKPLTFERATIKGQLEEMEQITVRAASTIPEDIVDLAAGVPANELLVIIARNVDEYKRVARLEVEGRVEIQVVDGKGVAELDLKEYQILRLNQLQVMMLFRCLEKYMNGLRLDTINDILEENIAQAILTNV